MTIKRFGEMNMKKNICLVIGVVMALILTFGVAVEARHYNNEEPEPTPCWHCYGSGRCPACDGTGFVIIEDHYWEENEQVEIPIENSTMCTECYVSGQCQWCYGSGIM